MPMAGVAGGRSGYRPQSIRRAPIGTIALKRGRSEAEGVPFNLFPQIADRLPGILGDIVVETTEAVASKADAAVPVRTGRLKASRRIRYTRGKATGQVVTGRIDYKATDPTEAEPKHEYGFFVEVGTVKTPAQPFLTPSVVSERGPFNERLRGIERRL